MENLPETTDAEFANYLVRSQAANYILKMIVGIAEAQPRPENPVDALREMFDRELDPSIADREDQKFDVKAALQQRDELAHRVDELTAQVEEKRAQLAEHTRLEQQPLLVKLFELFATESKCEDEVLDLGKVADALKKCSIDDDESDVATIAPWAVEGFEHPKGLAPMQIVSDWALEFFGIDAGVSLEVLLESCCNLSKLSLQEANILCAALSNLSERVS